MVLKGFLSPVNRALQSLNQVHTLHASQQMLRLSSLQRHVLRARS